MRSYLTTLAAVVLVGCPQREPILGETALEPLPCEGPGECPDNEICNTYLGQCEPWNVRGCYIKDNCYRGEVCSWGETTYHECVSQPIECGQSYECGKDYWCSADRVCVPSG